MTTVNNLEHERNDCFAFLRVIFELFLVVAVFAECPYRHLVHSGSSKEVSRQALRHDGEREPSAKLVKVVGARDEVEESGQWVGVRNRDLSDVGACWP